MTVTGPLLQHIVDNPLGRVPLSRSYFFLLQRLRAIKQSLATDATRTLVHVFVSGRLDSGSSLLAGASSQLLQRLQVVQNAAARLVTGARRSEHNDACFTRSLLAAGSTADHV